MTGRSILRARHGDPVVTVPLVCVCDRPLPLEVYLWGCAHVEGAYECGRCGRRVWSG